jgi:hypothetical protein
MPLTSIGRSGKSGWPEHQQEENAEERRETDDCEAFVKGLRLIHNATKDLLQP